jgi:hypothetical protein
MIGPFEFVELRISLYCVACFYAVTKENWRGERATRSVAWWCAPAELRERIAAYDCSGTRTYRRTGRRSSTANSSAVCSRRQRAA